MGRVFTPTVTLLNELALPGGTFIKALSGSYSASVSLWVYPDMFYTASGYSNTLNFPFGTIHEKSGSSTTAYGFSYIGFYSASSFTSFKTDKLKPFVIMRTSTQGSAPYHQTVANDFVYTGSWTHLAYTFVANNNPIKIYKNGILQTPEYVLTGSANRAITYLNTTFEYSDSLGTINTNSPASPLSFYRIFSGSISEIGVWKSELTSKDIEILFSGSKPYRVDPTNLVLYWPMNVTSTANEAELINKNTGISIGTVISDFSLNRAGSPVF